MITKGSKYFELHKSFIIFICTTFDPFNEGRHLYTFENLCNQNPSLRLGDETSKVFLTTCGTLDDVDQEMLEFLAYIKNSTDKVASESKSQLVHKINEKVQSIKEDKRTEVEYMTLLERDERNREEGRNEERRSVAKNLLQRGLDDEFVFETTNLSLDEIKKLRQELELN